MKKTYQLEHPKIKVPRIVDSIKHDIKKYLKKERSKKLPYGTKYWGFDCKVGELEESAIEVPLSSLTQTVDALVAQDKVTIYIEITPNAIEADEI